MIDQDGFDLQIEKLVEGERQKEREEKGERGGTRRGRKREGEWQTADGGLGRGTKEEEGFFPLIPLFCLNQGSRRGATF